MVTQENQSDLMGRHNADLAASTTRVLEGATGLAHPRGAPLDTSRIASIRMGTTVGVERRRELPLRCRAGAAAWTLLEQGGLNRAAVALCRPVPPADACRSPCGHNRRWPPTRCWSARASARRWW